MDDAKIVDCRGLACPQPVLRTREALAETERPLLVIVDNEGSSANVSRFAESRGARVSLAREGADFQLTIEPNGAATADQEAPIECDAGAATGTVVYVSSTGMGSGDEELGTTLMVAFLDTLSQFRGQVSHAIFVNGGARLAVTGSPALDQIRQLEELGVEVLVCGTCLNHFGLMDELAAGSVSNMYAIIETLSRAGRIIRP
jgi:selenium metabolism protein YedF